MTTVAVVRKGGWAAIAADGLTSFGELALSGAESQGRSKLVAAGGAFVGIAGSAAHNAVLESYVAGRTGPLRFGSRLEVFETWRAMHATLKDAYFLNPKDEASDPYENTHMTALIASPSGVFGIYSLRDVFEYRRFWALGSGRDLALGALGALYDRLETAEEIVREAVRVACAFDKSSGPPVDVRTVHLKKPRAARAG